MFKTWAVTICLAALLPAAARAGDVPDWLAVHGQAERHPPTMTAYALRDGEDTILVDPLVAGETDPLLTEFDEIGAQSPTARRGRVNGCRRRAI